MKISRRDLLRLAGITVAGLVLPSCMDKKEYYSKSIPWVNGGEEAKEIFSVREGVENVIDDYLNSRLIVGVNAPASDTMGAVDIQTILDNEIIMKYGSGSMPPAGLDSEVIFNLHHSKPGSFRDTNLISVGNSQNNMVTNYLRGNPEPWDSGLPEDKGVIQLSKVMRHHIAVTGKTDGDVRKGCEVIANFRDYNLQGKLIYVSGDISTGLVTEIIVP